MWQKTMFRCHIPCVLKYSIQKGRVMLIVVNVLIAIFAIVVVVGLCVGIGILIVDLYRDLVIGDDHYDNESQS